MNELAVAIRLLQRWVAGESPAESTAAFLDSLHADLTGELEVVLHLDGTVDMVEVDRVADDDLALGDPHRRRTSFWLPDVTD